MISTGIILCVLAFFIKLNCISASSETYKSIIWDPQNPLFVDGKSNCDPAYKHKLLKIRSASKIKFICPNVATVMQTTASEVSKSNMYENLWLLYDKTSFDKCDTTLDPKNITQPLLRCKEPTELEFHSITFQPFAAEPHELTFHKGHSYYFIATSNGLISHINDTSGGHCNDTANDVYMKIEVYVCNSTQQVDEAWMAVAMVLMVLCIVLVFGIVYLICVKKKGHKYEHKIKPSPEFGRKNHAFKADCDGSLPRDKPSVTEEGDGSLPDKNGDLVIYNKEVSFHNTVNGGGKDIYDDVVDKDEENIYNVIEDKEEEGNVPA